MFGSQSVNLTFDPFLVHNLNFKSLNEKWKIIFYIYILRAFQSKKKFNLDICYFYFCFKDLKHYGALTFKMGKLFGSVGIHSSICLNFITFNYLFPFCDLTLIMTKLIINIVNFQRWKMHNMDMKTKKLKRK